MKELKLYQGKIANLTYVINILKWELKVSAPKDSKEELLEIISSYDLKLFDMKTSNKYGKLLKDFINSKEYDKLSKKEQKYYLNLLNTYNKEKNIPKEFYQKYKKLCDKSTLIWEEAKEKQDYKMFKPYLKKIIKFTKEYYSYLQPNMNTYDVMLDSYERGTSIKAIDRLFDEFKKEIIPLIKNIKPKKSIKLNIDYSEEELLKCSNYILNYIGLNTNASIIGIYPHGFMQKIGPNDLRIAYKKENNPINFLTTLIHEGGHALFEQNVDQKLSKIENLPINGLNAMHECQSRFYENILGRNKNFWKPIYKDITKILKLDIPLEEFAENLNLVKSSLIRVDADELTYCLHIIIRYEMEKEIFINNVDIDKLPKLWNQKTKEYLGLDVPDDSLGIMQDVHWAGGEFGYFPSYLLGTIYSGIFLETIEEKLGSIDDILKNGKIQDITNFLTQKIYKNGDIYTSEEIIKKVCKKEISVKPIIKYFYNKYDI